MRTLLAWAICLALLLPGCGGGGGGSTGTPDVVAITAQPVEQTLVPGQSTRFTVSAVHASAYQWQVDAGSGWVDIAGGTGASYTVAQAVRTMDGQQYRVRIEGPGGPVTSSAVTLRVHDEVIAPALVASPIPQTVMAGEDAVFDVTATGTSLSYRWERSADGTLWSTVAAAVEPQLRFATQGLAMDGWQFRAVISNSAGSVTSASAVLHVQPVPVLPGFVQQPQTTTAVVGQHATFTAIGAGTPAPTLQWQRSNDGATWTDLDGATGSAFTTPVLTLSDDGTRYRVVAANEAGATPSTAATLRVTPVAAPPLFAQQPHSLTLAAGTTPTFTVVVTGTPAPALQWQTSRDGNTWFNINNATGTSLTLAAATGADNGNLYRVLAFNPSGSTVSEAAALLVSSAGGGTLSLFYGRPGGYGNLDGAGSGARFGTPTGLAFDRAGNLLVSDWFGSAVRMMTPQGIVSTLAGLNNVSGHVDGDAPAARFSAPSGVATDGAGQVYVADRFNHAIRKISADGRVSTLFAGADDPRALVADASGTVYVCDGATIRRIAPDGSSTILAGAWAAHGHVDGVGSDARFNAPSGIALSPAGVLVVVDDADHTVRQVTMDGRVTTLAGTPGQAGYQDGPGAVARFSQPQSVAVDAAGIVYVADMSNNVIRAVDASGIVSTWMGAAGVGRIEDGNRATARLSQPVSLAFAPDGRLYVGDGPVIRRADASGLVTVAGLYEPVSWTPAGVVMDSHGVVYVADAFGSGIARFAANGQPLDSIGGAGLRGSADGPPAIARFHSPSGLAIDAADRVYVADTDNHTIRVIAPDGTVSTLAGMAGVAGSSDGRGSAARFNRPTGVAVDLAGNVYVADFGNHTVRKILPDGTVSTLSGLAGMVGYADGAPSEARYVGPHSVAVDTTGRVYVGDGSNTIRRIDVDGRSGTLAGRGQQPGSADGVGGDARFGSSLVLAWADGMLVVSDTANATLRTVDASGRVTTIAGVAGQAGLRLGNDARFSGINAIASAGVGQLLLTTGTEQSVLAFERQP